VSTLPAITSSFDPADLRTAATGYAATLTNALHEDANARRAAGASPEEMVLHLADAADLLDLIAKAFTNAATEARAATEIDKDRSACIDAVWIVPAPDGSAVRIGPDVKKATTWDEGMLSVALARHTFNELSAELLTEFAPIDVTGPERDRMMRAVEAGVRTAIGQGRHAWRVTDLARVRQALAHADAAEATLIDRAKTETSEVGEGVKVTRIPAKPVKPKP
jgi:hypothetical protein